MATPDDLEERRAYQMSDLGLAARWNDLSRGAAHWIEAADAAARSIGLKPLLSRLRTEDEGDCSWCSTIYRTIDELQADLDAWVADYNLLRRPHWVLALWTLLSSPMRTSRGCRRFE
jgi:hypothetical protein